MAALRAAAAASAAAEALAEALARAWAEEASSGAMQLVASMVSEEREFALVIALAAEAAAALTAIFAARIRECRGVRYGSGREADSKGHIQVALVHRAGPPGPYMHVHPNT